MNLLLFRLKPVLLLPVFLFLLGLQVQGQTNPESKTFLYASGIRQEQTTFYETEGYAIFSEELEMKLDEKGIKKLKKRYSIDKDSVARPDPDFPGAHRFTSRKGKGKGSSVSIRSFTDRGDGMVMVIGFDTHCDQVKAVEKEFYDAIRTRTVPDFVFTPQVVDSIRFAGRFIKLGPVCRWMRTHSMQCPYRGQINWSEFSDSSRAWQMVEAQKGETAEYSMGHVLEEKQVPVLFEGQPATATRTRVKIRLPKLVMGGSNELVVYYVVAEVRGRYVACVLSHYTDDAKEGELPPLCGEVMVLR